MSFRRKGKLNHRYIGPFEILRVVGEVVFKLALPPDIAVVYLVFHVSKLQMYNLNSSHVLRWDSIHLDEQLAFCRGTRTYFV